MQNLCDRSPPYVCVVGGLGGPEKALNCFARDPGMEDAAQPGRLLFGFLQFSGTQNGLTGWLPVEQGP
jgi:hypothetical protein